MEEVVWSSGEKYQKSNKIQKPLLNSKNEIIHNIAHRGEYIVKKNNKENEQKREELLDRYLISQQYQNPFFHKNFMDVLHDQEKYLMPQNSLINDNYKE